MMMIRLWIAACLSGMVLVTSAATWQEPMSVELILGERDTRMTVRAAALDEMRARASQKVGQIVESTMISDGQKLTEEIRTVGVSLVQIDSVKDEVRLQQDGSMRLVVTGMVTVDTSELDRRAAAMREDGNKVEKIRQLAADNQTLRRSLADVTKLLGQQASPTTTADLLKRQAVILESLASNVERVGQTFRAGALLELAEKEDTAWAAVKEEIDTGVLERILMAPVNAKIMWVESTSNGVTAVVQVGWDADTKSIYEVLRRYEYLWPIQSEEASRKGLIYMSPRENGTSASRPFAARVHKYLEGNRIALEISLGGVSRTFPMLFVGNSFDLNTCSYEMTISKYNADQATVCMSFQKKTVTSMLGLNPAERDNPAKFNLTMKQANDATALTATWILRKQDGTLIRRPAQVL
ncbi:hypothetical protein [Rhodoferax sp. GW822-FHT02A01]|uniref:hypothetical protein n=1 Tax=Rhodoferax sp. GW822-FHT02A01 TaxID=3141537 RepID=UPI00315DAF98